MGIGYTWRGPFDSAEVEVLHANGFGSAPASSFDWRAQAERHSLGWVCARLSGKLVGWVNIAWDGSSHAFILDTVVAKELQRQGVGAALVAEAARGAAAAGCRWMHVDFEEHLSGFYLGACGFRPTKAGLLKLQAE
ncbi:MAG TPA: GNAT family N-acetyltransferase [Candidatus Limnocylindrales bacterium]